MKGEQELGDGDNIKNLEGTQEDTVKKDWVRKQLLKQYHNDQWKLLSWS